MYMPDSVVITLPILPILLLATAFCIEALLIPVYNEE